MVLLVIQAWARSTAPDKAMRAWNLLERMHSRYNKGEEAVRPSVKALTSVLNACAYTTSRQNHEEAVEIARKVQEMIIQDKHGKFYGKPESAFFDLLLKTFAFCVHDEVEQERLMISVIRHCCDEGQMDTRILETIKRSANLFHQLPSLVNMGQVNDQPEKVSGFKGGLMSVQDLPRTCWRNVRARRLK